MKISRLLLVFLFLWVWNGESLVPPKMPPSELVANYTMGGQIPMEYFYVDDTLQGEETHFVYTEQQIEREISSAKRLFERFSQFRSRFSDVKASELIWKLPKKQWVYYGLFLSTQRIKGATVAVIGSMDPWIEAALLALDAKRVVTIEYNRLTYPHPRITTLSKADFPLLYDEDSEAKLEPSPYAHSFDLVISISSFDHDGLGRYGDPLSPSGDLLAMGRMKRLLKRSPQPGLLLLTVPVGPDLVVFNMHRRYGEKRLPLLLQGYEVVESWGWDERMLREKANYRQTYEPLFLLQPSISERPETIDLLSLRQAEEREL